MISRTRLCAKLLKLGFEPSQLLSWLAIRHAIGDSHTVLDVGCGGNSNVRVLECPHLTGFEGYRPSYEKALAVGTHDRMILGDVRQLAGVFEAGSFECCIAIDVIEHLPKEEGLAFARNMERIASRRVVIITPSGFLPQGHAEEGDLQAHHSGWDPAEMREMGYKVVGLLGPKAWRGEYHRLRHRPRFLWAALSLIAHLLWTKRHPESAAAILCVKNLKPEA